MVYGRELDSDEIADIMRTPYLMLMRDQLDLDEDKIPVKFPVILNLDITGGSGTHWVMFMRVSKKTMLYYDSFGRPPPMELIDLCERYDWTLKYIDVQIQSPGSTACGYFVIWVVNELLKDQKPESLNRKLQSVFSTNLSLNDDIVYEQLS